jgi:hypothetical protein
MEEIIMLSIKDIIEMDKVMRKKELSVLQEKDDLTYNQIKGIDEIIDQFSVQAVRRAGKFNTIYSLLEEDGSNMVNYILKYYKTSYIEDNQELKDIVEKIVSSVKNCY